MAIKLRDVLKSLLTASNLADGLGLKNVEIEINYLASEFLSKKYKSKIFDNLILHKKEEAPAPAAYS